MIIKQSKKIPSQPEKTGPQTISYSFGDGILRRDYTRVGTYIQLRAVRRDPTVALARGLLISSIQAGSWNIEADEDVSDEVIDFIKHILPLREDFLFNAVAYGKVDFGWCGFEKIFKLKDGRILIDALKPLLHDMTHILVTKHGRFNGYKQLSLSWGMSGSPQSGGPLYPAILTTEKCLHTAFGVEAGNYYGMPLLENIRAAVDDWGDCNAGAKRYDNKVAGSIFIVMYPPGTTLIDDEWVDNGIVAASVLTALETEGSVAIPTTAAQVVQELTNAGVKDVMGWHIELLSDSGNKQVGFGKRLSYLDSQKVRGLLMPERALLEGEHGTKAEAGEHIGLMLTNMQEIDKHITRMVNQQLVNQLLQLNFGDELVDKVRLVSAPLVDKQIVLLEEVYKNQNDSDIDLQALRDKLGVPTEIGGSESIVPDMEKDKDEEDEE